MKFSLPSLVACAACFPVLATADLAHDIAKCGVDRNNVTRLACYDTLAPKASAMDPAKSTSSLRKWLVNTETSKIDDSKNVDAMVHAETAINGWLAGKAIYPLFGIPMHGAKDGGIHHHRHGAKRRVRC